MVVDYRGLNKITIGDEYHMAKIHDLINRLGKSQWFSKLDLQPGYRHVRVAHEDQWETSFKRRFGQLEFKQGFALRTSWSSSAFQRLLQHVFLPELDRFVSVYLDGIWCNKGGAHSALNTST